MPLGRLIVWRYTVGLRLVSSPLRADAELYSARPSSGLKLFQ
uniref:Uncharacterized protein n=1 Tax=Salmonella derby TaxID=28144 RepID=A0A1S7BGD7_SALDE|nr:hypothetical protein [Salmonella enterica subsp. enterica serovar Derby]